MQSKTADGIEAPPSMVPELDHVGDPGTCDLCGRPLGDELSFCDAELPAQGGRWGMLCKPCADCEGVQPSWGRAQFYERQGFVSGQAIASAGQAQLRWRCVAGTPPVDVVLD